MSSRRFALSLVRVERDGGVATITLDRPDHLNVMTPALAQQVRWAFDEVADEPEISGVVIAGAGKAFSVGADIAFAVRNIEAEDFERIQGVTYFWQALYKVIAACPKPVIARVHAAAMGAGMELALACHGIVATPKASFCLPEAGLGIFPCLGGTQRSARAIGPGLAKWMMYTGATVRASDALNIGLIRDVVDEAELDTACRRYALDGLPEKAPPELSLQFASLEAFFLRNRVDDVRSGQADTAGDPVLGRAMKSTGSKGPLSLRCIEQLIDNGFPRPLDEGLQMELDRVVEIYRSADAHRGLVHRMRNLIGAPAFEGR
jgi:enoyl-CoA hydratase/3-hydroxyacyl-CoA dehydrogenase